MNKEFVPYVEALALKELGFNEPCFGYYSFKGKLTETKVFRQDHYTNQSALAPLFQQAFRWFREKHGIFVSIVPNRHGSLDSFIGWIYVPLNGSTKDINVGDYKIGFDTPEEAELECLIKLIEIVKTK
jgi:hypothetical protein